MKTNGSGNIYSHGNIGVKFADVVIDLGFLRVFWGRYSSQSYNGSFYQVRGSSNDIGFP